MCKSPEHIKLCTCVDDSIEIEELDHYWILYRFNPNKKEITLGSIVNPFDEEIIPPIDYISAEGESEEDRFERIVLKRLNDGTIFDKELDIKEADRLHIVVNAYAEEGCISCEFQNFGGVWVNEIDEDPSDPFYFHNKFDEVFGGEVKEERS